MTTHGFGWRPQLGDARDIHFAAPVALLQNLPAQIDLTAQCPPVYDQGQLGSCTANAIGGAFEFSLIKQGLQDFVPSRLFIYYYERVLEHTVHSDSGAALRDGMKVVNTHGACPETEWPYDIHKFTNTPPKQCRIDALKEHVLSYRSITQDLAQMKACLASGLPFVFGISVYQSFLDASDGNIPMPMTTANDKPLNEGHAILAVGYDDAKQVFLFRNSWGTTWGNQGYGTIPYGYLTSSDASDFWSIDVIGGGIKAMLAAFDEARKAS